ncbi:MAG: hypothetical protein O3B43_00285 [Chloroflexi bacterium]|nr:hypothetical protein [Chloroflexota bacterium]
MALSKIAPNRKSLLAILLLAAVTASFAWGFAHLPLENSGVAIDWKQIWGATHGLQANYITTELRTPPWAVPLLWPLTIFTLGTSLGLAAFATVSVLVHSIPKTRNKPLWFFAILSTVIAYPTLRQLIDGNVEALVIGGALLVLWATEKRHPLGLAIGALTVAAKIQASLLLLIVLGYWLLVHWPRRDLVQAFSWSALLVAAPLAWKGAEWWNAMTSFPWTGTAIDSSLLATLSRLGVSATSSLLLWISLAGLTAWFLFSRPIKLGRIQFGWLVSASLLLGPYAASNSVLTPYALGVIPMLLEKPTWGFALVAAYNLPYLFLAHPDIRFAWESSYWTLVLLITWAVLAFSLLAHPEINRTAVQE